MKKRVTSVLVICILLGALLACSHDRLIDETEAKQILEEYLDSCELLGPDESGAEYELDSGYEKKVYAEQKGHLVRFAACEHWFFVVRRWQVSGDSVFR